MNKEQAMQTLNDMVEALNALHYLDTLLDVALNADGGMLSDVHSGLHFLMKSQLDTFGDGINLLRDHVRGGEADEITPHTQPTYDETTLRADIEAEEAAAVARLRRADLEAIARQLR